MEYVTKSKNRIEIEYYNRKIEQKEQSKWVL